MTDPTISRATVYQGEVQFVSWNENGNGRKAVFTLDPLIGEVHPFKHIKPGRRLMLVAVLIGDDEQPEAVRTPAVQQAQAEPAQRTPEPRYSKARRMCGVTEFQQWVSAQWPLIWGDYEDMTDYARTDKVIKYVCQVESKAEFDGNKPAAMRWDALLTDYDNRHHIR